MIEIYFGCMYSGKTSRVKKTLSQLYSEEEYLYFDLSDEELRKEATLLQKIREKSTLRCVALDEFQFLEEENEEKLLVFLHQLEGYHVLISLLDMDYLGNSFEIFDMLVRSLSKKDTVRFTHMKGTCQYCLNASLYSVRIHEDANRILLGKQHYEPCCELCFQKSELASVVKILNEMLPDSETHGAEQVGEFSNTT